MSDLDGVRVFRWVTGPAMTTPGSWITVAGFNEAARWVSVSGVRGRRVVVYTDASLHVDPDPRLSKKERLATAVAAVAAVIPELRVTATASVPSTDICAAETAAIMLGRRVAKMLGVRSMICTDSAMSIDALPEYETPTVMWVPGHAGTPELAAHALADRLAGRRRRLACAGETGTRELRAVHARVLATAEDGWSRCTEVPTLSQGRVRHTLTTWPDRAKLDPKRDAEPAAYLTPQGVLLGEALPGKATGTQKRQKAVSGTIRRRGRTDRVRVPLSEAKFLGYVADLLPAA